MPSPDPTKPLSMSKSAIKKRRSRERARAKQIVAEIELAKQTILHETKPITAPNMGPDRFAAIPDVSDAEIQTPPAAEPTPQDDAHGTAASDGSAPQPETPPQPAAAPASGTTPEEAKMFGAALVWYFHLGTGALLAKDPRAAQMAAALLSNVPRPPGAPALTSDQAIAALSAFIAGCGERCAMKYNLRIPYLDEGVVVATIGFATWGLIYSPDKKRAKQAKDANPKPDPNAQPAQTDQHATQTNGVGDHPPDDGAVPIHHTGNVIDLDAHTRGGD